MNHSVTSPINHVPTLDIDTFSIEFLTNPYPYYEQLRAQGNVVFLPKYNTYAIVGFEEVQEAVSNWQVFSSDFGTGLKNFKYEEPELFPKNLILEVDPPDHTKIRTVLSSVISRSSFADMREQFQTVADEMISALVNADRLDGVHDIAEAFHLKAFGDYLGLEEEDRDNLITLTNSAFNEFGAVNEIVEECRSELMGPVSWALGCSLRDALAPGSFGAKLYEKVDEGLLTDDEAAPLFRSVLTGSYNTIHNIADILACFALYPEQWQALKAAEQNYALRSQVFDEVVRFCSPLQTYFRTTTQTTELGGVVIPAETKVQLFLAAANRDPHRWLQANQFDIAREQRPHVALGKGPHACVGEQIARMEADAILEALLKFVPAITLVDEPKYHLNNMLRGLASLPITFKAGAKNVGFGAANVVSAVASVNADNTALKEITTQASTAGIGLKTVNSQAAAEHIPGRLVFGADRNPKHQGLDSQSQQSHDLVVNALAEIIEQRKTDHFEAYWFKDYIQHNPRIPNGSAVVKRFFTMLRPKGLSYEFGISIAEGNIVALFNVVDNFLSKPRQVVIDFFRVADGKLVEHWDLLQEIDIAATTASGNPVFSLSECEASTATVAENKQRVSEALHKLLIDRDEASVAEYWHQDLIQHDAAIANGSQGLVDYINGLANGFSVDIGFIMGQGNTVISQSRWLVEGKAPFIVGEIFRIEDGKIAEQWRVTQEEISANKAISGNAMYPVKF